MNGKYLIIVCLAVSCFLAGCGAKFGLAKGGGKVTIPFDLPRQETTDLHDEKGPAI